MSRPIPLSVLDLSPVPAGGTAADALRNTVDLAQTAERSGYHRYWVAEHHLTAGVASSAPAEGADLELWVLGSSPGESARAAGAAGLPFAASYHIQPSGVLDTVAAYRESFRPSETLERPYVMVSADVVVADDDESARE